MLNNFTIDFEPDQAAFRKMIKYDDFEEDLQEEADRFFEDVKHLLVPNAYAYHTTIEEFQVVDGLPNVTIDGVLLKGNILEKIHRKNDVVPYIISCGQGFEDFPFDDYDFMAEYWAEDIKYQAINRMVPVVKDIFRKELNCEKLPSIAPGSGNLEQWPITDLAKIFELIGQKMEVNTVKLINDSYMLPNKSLAGIMFPDDRDWFTCSLCRRKNCIGRKEPYSGPDA